ncbi:MAG: ABC transporter ATP-binding protein, partial [Clostridia bacterium]|nr:ABC transporter ATP-binding protein [Clostridia bacterium]
MLSLKNITKDYVTGDAVVHALRGVSLDFRRSEFVSILGASGCGKTTLLNIVGGLDRYTSGDLVINGVSTKEYADGDWDAYRNHTIGFVFQTYNLIGHQTVLGNVELALTLSGVSKEKRREMAAAALEKVGLKEYLNKKPNQLSGGQMQRVAIARAIVNNPDIILADEPTGAIDTVTSVQIMDILKEIAADRLVIMVTHNPEIAEKYSTRIVRLSDGLVISDTDPVTESEIENLKKEDAAKAAEGEISAEDKNAKSADNVRKTGVKRKKRPSMSFITALTLSLRNLLTKKARTILVSFAGSIGIIGIALILSLSDGFQVYINKVQEDTLSSYPLTIQSQSIDMSSMVSALMGLADEEAGEREPETVYSRGIMVDIIKTLSQAVHINDLKKFNEKLLGEEDLKKAITAIRYSYDLDLQVYFDKDEPLNKNGETFLVNPSSLLRTIFGSYNNAAISSMGGGVNSWTEMLDNTELLKSQYDLMGDSRWPQNYDEVVIAIDTNSEINDFILYSLGLLPQSDITALMKGEEIETGASFTYDQLLGLKYKLLINTEKYKFDNLGYHGEKTNEEIIQQVEEGEEGVIEIKVVGIVRPKKSAAATSINGTIGYTSALTREVIKRIAASDIVKAQLMRQDVNVLTGEEFNITEGETLERNFRRFG